MSDKVPEKIVTFKDLPVKSPVVQPYRENKILSHRVDRDILRPVISPEILKMATSEQLYKDINFYVRSVNYSYLAIAAILYELRERNEHTKHGYHDFHRYISTKCALSRFKTYSLLRVYSKLIEIPYPRERIEKIGWSKLQYISPYLTEDSLDVWLDICETHSSHEVGAIARAYKAKLGIHPLDHHPKFEKLHVKHDPVKIAESVQDITQLAIFISKEKKALVKETLDTIKKQQDISTDADALEWLCMYYLAIPKPSILRHLFSYFGFNRILEALKEVCPDDILIEVTKLNPKVDAEYENE